VICCLQACEKNATSTSNNLTASAQDNATGIKKLVLQPRPADGYDTWLTYKNGDDVITNSNWDTVSITAAYAWTAGGIPIIRRKKVTNTLIVN
jgi:hypothetical protein